MRELIIDIECLDPERAHACMARIIGILWGTCCISQIRKSVISNLHIYLLSTGTVPR